MTGPDSVVCTLISCTLTRERGVNRLQEGAVIIFDGRYVEAVRGVRARMPLSSARVVEA